MNYIKDIFRSMGSMLSGMQVTGHYFLNFRKALTEEYPENRNSLKLSPRFKGELTLMHNAENMHKCTGCSACEIACPNGSIHILEKREMTSDGKNKKRLQTFVWQHSMCTFCSLCVDACPTAALKMDQGFEFSFTDRAALTKILNHEGSQLEPDLK
jgi:NADH-quinone oxidoreductase subunit I